MHPPHLSPTFQPFRFTGVLSPLVILRYSLSVQCMYETHTVLEQVLQVEHEEPVQEDAEEQVPAFEHAAEAEEIVKASMSVTIKKIDIVLDFILFRYVTYFISHLL